MKRYILPEYNLTKSLEFCSKLPILPASIFRADFAALNQLSTYGGAFAIRLKSAKYWKLLEGRVRFKLTAIGNTLVYSNSKKSKAEVVLKILSYNDLFRILYNKVQSNVEKVDFGLILEEYKHLDIEISNEDVPKIKAHYLDLVNYLDNNYESTSDEINTNTINESKVKSKFTDAKQVDLEIKIGETYFKTFVTKDNLEIALQIIQTKLKLL